MSQLGEVTADADYWKEKITNITQIPSTVSNLKSADTCIAVLDRRNFV